MRAMKSSFSPLGQASAQAPMTVQPPKPSWLCRSTMLSARVFRSGSPWGSSPRWLIFPPVKSEADALGQAATQAPQPMQAAASMDRSDSFLPTRMLFASRGPPALMET